MAERGWHDEGAPRPAPVDVAPAPVVRPGPDALRDGRVDAYRDRERRRAARALDRYIESLSGETAVSAVAGERVIELVGDYVLARLSQRSVDETLARVSTVADEVRDGMAHLYDCCSAGPTEPHTADCPRNGA